MDNESSKSTYLKFITSMVIVGTIGVFRRYIDPVVAIFASCLFLGEPLSILEIIGAVLIIGSAIISERNN